MLEQCLIDTMIDIETWDLKETAIVRAIALVQFDAHTGAVGEKMVIDCRPTVDAQIAAGRTSIKECVEWAAETCSPLESTPALNPAERENTETQSFGESHLLLTLFDIPEVLDAIEGFLESYKIKASPKDRVKNRIWTRHYYDIGVLKSLFSADGRELPVEYYQIKDTASFDTIEPAPENPAPHCPLNDCLTQIKHVQAAHELADLARITQSFCSGEI